MIKNSWKLFHIILFLKRGVAILQEGRNLVEVRREIFWNYSLLFHLWYLYTSTKTTRISHHLWHYGRSNKRCMNHSWGRSTGDHLNPLWTSRVWNLWENKNRCYRNHLHPYAGWSWCSYWDRRDYGYHDIGLFMGQGIQGNLSLVLNSNPFFLFHFSFLGRIFFRCGL